MYSKVWIQKNSICVFSLEWSTILFYLYHFHIIIIPFFLCVYLISICCFVIEFSLFECVHEHTCCCEYLFWIRILFRYLPVVFKHYKLPSRGTDVHVGLGNNPICLSASIWQLGKARYSSTGEISYIANLQYYCDFGLPILLQWQNIVLLQLVIIYAVEKCYNT